MQRIEEEPQQIVAELRELLAQAAGEPPSPRGRGLRAVGI
jgi:hypothetical protein